MKLLFVDDDVEMLKFVKYELNSHSDDLSITTAMSGYDAMSLLKAQKFDLVCTDYAMQNGDGGSLASFCQDQGIECVVLTGYEAEYVAPYLPKGAKVFDKIRFFMGHSCGPQNNKLGVLKRDSIDFLHKLQCRLGSAGGCVNDQRRKAG